ncbi:MAG: macro domain-containing protein [Phototrophicaceae bacterium]
MTIKLILVDPHPDMIIAWHAYFENLPNVEIIKDYFETLSEFDCMVSAANSFGLMDGGVDLAISNYFGNSLQERVQQRIIDNFRGEQPVGTSIIVETKHDKHPFLAHTPTMRVPLNIQHTDNVYLAMWSMLLAVNHHNKVSDKPIKTVACPGLGTGYGQMPFTEAARQMALAYKNFLQPPTNMSWQYAGKRQRSIRFGGGDGFSIKMD